MNHYTARIGFNRDGAESGALVEDQNETLQAVILFINTPYGSEGNLARDNALKAMEYLAELMNSDIANT